MNNDESEWTRWRESRAAALRKVPGNLALVSYQPAHTKPAPIEFLPQLTAWREADEAGVRITIAPGHQVTIDGAEVSGEVFLGRLRPDGTPLLSSGSHCIDAFSLDGSDYELRIYDAEAPNIANFSHIEYYDHDPAMVATGSFEPFETTSAVSWQFTRATDSGHTKQVPGQFNVHLGGQDYQLQAFADGPDLVLVFADGTTGAESYAPGRFLRMPLPAAGADFPVDFNRAFIPPCGFSDFYSCPIPPAANRLPVPIRAGECKVIWHRPRY